MAATKAIAVPASLGEYAAVIAAGTSSATPAPKAANPTKVAVRSAVTSVTHRPPAANSANVGSSRRMDMRLYSRRPPNASHYITK
ncbi:hypothetical protein IWGMT90018_40850 [Mycobacterium kiyosense]|nr:hypothetical protein IWGMT90018_40850 [Mycobacterium kiyosense]